MAEPVMTGAPPVEVAVAPVLVAAAGPEPEAEPLPVGVADPLLLLEFASQI
jgi:hypothetical protein